MEPALVFVMQLIAAHCRDDRPSPKALGRDDVRRLSAQFPITAIREIKILKV
eukprot:CAMPEP_0115884966 /NCGR_PEP_ID=MMETSP0287-20121206/30408_1 /TAXON_ID=412157 /ORGANISM="Chrysochromulina rotalis, Strain UIO044" /LENGTH=51 /DNA_ID=CAMNT_0003341323 /DNA_START=40 /DNA_END=193 /DNA_ORIENTATION=-